MSNNKQMKFVDAILGKLRSRLEHCVPDPDDRQHCERLCRDLRVQYKGTMRAWTETLRCVSRLEGRKKTLEAQIESLKAEEKSSRFSDYNSIRTSSGTLEKSAYS